MAGAVVLRILGLWYGLPFPLVSDEEILIGGALRMAQTGQLVPTLSPELATSLYYPVLLPYLYLLLAGGIVTVSWIASGFPGLETIPQLGFESIGAIFFAARLTAAGFSVATCWFVYRLASGLYNSRAAGLVAAALAATSWYSVVLAHSARHWSATVFFIWLATWLAWRYWQKPTARQALGLGLATGLGFGASYIGAAGLGSALLAHFLRFRFASFNRMIGILFGVFAVLAVTFILLHFDAVHRLLGGDAARISTSRNASLLEFIRFYGERVWWAEAALVLAGLIGLPLAALRRPGGTAIVILGGLGWVTIIYFMVREDRFIMPALPCLAILAGGGYAKAMELIGARAFYRALLTTIAIVAVAYSLLTTSWMSVLMARDDTRLQARRWLIEHASPTEPVVVQLAPVKVSANIEGLRDQHRAFPDSLDAEDRLHLAKPDTISKAATLRAVHVHRNMASTDGDVLLATLREMGYRTYALAQRPDLPVYRFVEAVRSAGSAVAVFQPSHRPDAPTAPDLRTTILVDGPVTRLFRLERLGPPIEITRLR